jgi:hypothetical protein
MDSPLILLSEYTQNYSVDKVKSSLNSFEILSKKIPGLNYKNNILSIIDSELNIEVTKGTVFKVFPDVMKNRVKYYSKNYNIYWKYLLLGTILTDIRKWTSNSYLVENIKNVAKYKISIIYKKIDSNILEKCLEYY